MNTPKELIIHNQIQTLSHLYIMLASSLAPTIVRHSEGVEVVPSNFPKAAASAMEVALIDVANRISQIVTDSSKWSVDKTDEAAYSKGMQEVQNDMERQMIAALMAEFGGAAGKAPKKRKKKGPDQNEQ